MAETIDDERDSAEPDEDWDGDEPDDLAVVDDLVDDDDDSVKTEESEATSPGDTDGEQETLDQLEAEELEMLTEDEAAESLPVDEAEELRQIRRATMSLESAADTAGDDEFVCASCFLVKAGNQLADKRKKICLDCA